jgi:hypothetical protein
MWTASYPDINTEEIISKPGWRGTFTNHVEFLTKKHLRVGFGEQKLNHKRIDLEIFEPSQTAWLFGGDNPIPV